MTALILQQLLELYFAVIYSWQPSSSETSLDGKKFIYLKNFTDFFNTDIFFWRMPVYLVG